jgi:hypothetical protein
MNTDDYGQPPPHWFNKRIPTRHRSACFPSLRRSVGKREDTLYEGGRACMRNSTGRSSRKTANRSVMTDSLGRLSVALLIVSSCVACGPTYHRANSYRYRPELAEAVEVRARLLHGQGRAGGNADTRLSHRRLLVVAGRCLAGVLRHARNRLLVWRPVASPIARIPGSIFQNEIGTSRPW